MTQMGTTPTEPQPHGLGLAHEHGRSLRFTHAGAELTRYVYAPWDAQLESPRPYLHPLRTLRGDLVSVYRPHDHIWHKGIAWSLPNIEAEGDAGHAASSTGAAGNGHAEPGPTRGGWMENFWGGATYLRDRGYEQLPNNGSMRHQGFDRLELDGAAAGGGRVRVAHRLDWTTQAEETWLREARSLDVAVHPEVDAWSLVFQTRFANVRQAPVIIGSPTTQGRRNAGYGGLFWRGPRSFTGGRVEVAGATGADDLMGTRRPWLAFTGQHDGDGRASTLAFVDAPDNRGHPVRWFVRSRMFACVCPAPFFSEEVRLEPGESLQLRYAVLVADGDRGAAGAARLAETGLLALEDAVALPALTGPGMRRTPAEQARQQGSQPFDRSS